MTPPAAAFSFASPAEAVAAMLERVQVVDTERIPLDAAAGRILAEPIRADRPSPAADVSAMDGYAVRLNGLTAGAHAVTGEVRIGHAPLPAEGGVVRIVTGAAVPADADTVIKREDVRELDGVIEIDREMLAAVTRGAHIRRCGENVQAGATVLEAGRRIDAPAAAALATFGVPAPLVHRRVRVGMLVTGDEVLSAADTPSPWELRDSNGPALRALLDGCAWTEVIGQRRAPDDPAAIQDAIESLLEQCDALLVTGGVSMGDRDYVPGALRAAGAQVLFHRLPQRPGKPVLGAITGRGQPVLALPGNPLSVMVTARRMGWPVLAKVAGLNDSLPPVAMLLEDGSGKRLDLWWQRLVRVIGPGRVALVEGMGSGDIASAARSDGFIGVPPEEAGAGPWPFYAWRP